jgi:hypothetical protein
MKKDKEKFNEIINSKTINNSYGLTKHYLFSRMLNKKEYKFYLVRLKSCINNSISFYYNVITPKNNHGYTDTIYFRNGVGQGIEHKHTNYIINQCKDALLKRGFRGGGLENDYSNSKVYFKN